MTRMVCSAAIALVVLAGCSGDNVFDEAKNEVPASTVAGSDTEGSGENVFLPEGNLSDCVGTVERPNCGSARAIAMIHAPSWHAISPPRPPPPSGRSGMTKRHPVLLTRRSA